MAAHAGAIRGVLVAVGVLLLVGEAEAAVGVDGPGSALLPEPHALSGSATTTASTRSARHLIGRIELLIIIARIKPNGLPFRRARSFRA